MVNKQRQNTSTHERNTWFYVVLHNNKNGPDSHGPPVWGSGNKVDGDEAQGCFPHMLFHAEKCKAKPLAALPPSPECRSGLQGKAGIIAEVCNLDKWTALWRGRGEGIWFQLSKPFEKTKGEKREPLSITSCLWCQLLKELGRHGVQSLILEVEKSRLLSGQVHFDTTLQTHTHTHYTLMYSIHTHKHTYSTYTYTQHTHIYILTTHI